MYENKYKYFVLFKDNNKKAEILNFFKTIEEAYQYLKDFTLVHNARCTAFPYELKNIGSYKYRSDNGNFYAYIERYILNEKNVYIPDLSFDRISEYKKILSDSEIPILVLKIDLIGNSGVGKTSWLNCIKNNKYTKIYVSIDNSIFSTFQLHTNKGVVEIKVRETIKYDPERFADGRILMCDLNDMKSHEDILNITDIVESMISLDKDCTNIFIFNKTDLRRVVSKKHNLIKYVDFFKIKNYEISTKNNFRTMTPLFDLIKQKMNDSSIEFIPKESIRYYEDITDTLTDLADI